MRRIWAYPPANGGKTSRVEPSETTTLRSRSETSSSKVNASARLVISGDAEAMDLYLWGRIDSSDPRISITGGGEETFKQLMQVAVL